MATDVSFGLVHIYAGDGKGKTTAAVGLAVRAAGADKRVLFAQFMKGGESGELAPLAAVGVTVFRLPASRKFVFQMDEEEKRDYSGIQRKIFAEATAMAADFDLLIMDEILSAVGTGMIPLSDVSSYLDDKPARLEVVLSGRDPDPALVERADYFSEIRCRKHPYERGVHARRGIEY